MGKETKREYIEILRRRYKATKGKKVRGAIIDELIANCEYNRKYAIRVLNRPGKENLRKKSKKRRKRKPIYLERVIELIKRIWELADYPCGPILKKVIPLWMPYIKKRWRLDEETEAQMLRISPAQLDRRLKRDKAKVKKRLYGTTKPGRLLKYQIEISTMWEVNQPGYVEMDTVAHCGSNGNGEFAYTVNNTDIHTFWVERRAILGKGQKTTLEAIKETDGAFPFTVVARDCDNGSEFINYHLVDYCKTNGIKLTRSRSYHKNDNAHIEQKNWTHVRKIFGYQRIETPEQVALMNDLYKNELRLFHNFFIPGRKLKEKVKKGNRTVRVYDDPQTPFERVLKAANVTKETKGRLKSIFSQLNPIQLRLTIDKNVAGILGYKIK